MNTSRGRDVSVPRVLLVCAGLDHARRGFESFARECFHALAADPGVALELVKGSGQRGPGETSVPTLRRDRLLASGLGRVTGRPPHRFEAFAFAFALVPLIMRRRPDVVYFSEWDTGRGLSFVRKITGLRFKLLLSNGTFADSGFEHLDHVQELTPAGRDHVLARGADPRRHTVLPLGFHIDSDLAPLSCEDRAALRSKAGLPAGRRIVLSVAALNRTHKRLDYLIEEVAALPVPRPFLLLVGEPDDETPSISALARERLGEDGYAMRTVPYAEVRDLYRMSDIFVLASMAEAQGRVLIEAMAHGLPCVAHDSPVMRFALGDYGRFGDFAETGALTSRLASEPVVTPEVARAGHRYVFEQFSWERLRPRYVELLRSVARANSTVSSSTGE